MASSNEMSLYAEPIPPTLAGKPPVSRANFREVVLRRLTAVQEQKKCMNSSPVRSPQVQSDEWRGEKDVLVEMLEKTQKLQNASQQARLQEREELERQLRRVEAQYKTQVDALKSDNERLRCDLSRAKSAQEDAGRKQELAQLQAVTKAHQDREDALQAQLRATELALAQYKEGLSKATEELEKKRFLADEQSAVLETKAEATISALRKEVAQGQVALRDKEEAVKVLSQELAQVRSQLETLRKKKPNKAASVQTDIRSEDYARLQSLVEEGKREVAAVRSQKDNEMATVKDESARLSQALLTANAALRAQAVVSQSVQSSGSQQELLARLQESLQLLRKLREAPALPQFTEIKSVFSAEGGWGEVSRSFSSLKAATVDLLSKCESASEAVPKSSDSEERAKLCIELYASSLKSLLDLARERCSTDSILAAENERLKKERDTLLVAIQSVKGKALDRQIEAIVAAVARVEAAARTVQGAETLCLALKTRCIGAVSALEACVAQIREKAEVESATESAVCQQLQALLSRLGAGEKDQERRSDPQQKERLEEALSKLKAMHDCELEALSQQYESYQSLVHTERGSLCDSLLRIAESVEYRQDLLEQLATASDAKEVTEEMERQSQWELQTLAVLMTKLQDPLQGDTLTDDAIKEEENEDDGDEQPAVVIRLK